MSAVKRPSESASSVFVGKKERSSLSQGVALLGRPEQILNDPHKEDLSTTTARKLPDKQVIHFSLEDFFPKETPEKRTERISQAQETIDFVEKAMIEGFGENIGTAHSRLFRRAAEEDPDLRKAAEQEDEIDWNFESPTELSKLGEAGKNFETFFSWSDTLVTKSSSLANILPYERHKNFIAQLDAKAAVGLESHLTDLRQNLLDRVSTEATKKALVERLPELYSRSTEFSFAARSLHAARVSRGEWSDHYKWNDDAFFFANPEQESSRPFLNPCSDEEIQAISASHDTASRAFQTAALDVSAAMLYATRGLRTAPFAKTFDVAREMGIPWETLLERLRYMDLPIENAKLSALSSLSNNGNEETKNLLKEVGVLGELHFIAENVAQPSNEELGSTPPNGRIARSIELAAFAEIADYLAEELWSRYDASLLSIGNDGAGAPSKAINFSERSDAERLALTVAALNALHAWFARTSEKVRDTRESLRIGPKLDAAPEKTEEIATDPDFETRLKELTATMTAHLSKIRGDLRYESGNIDVLLNREEARTYDYAVLWNVLANVFSRRFDWTEDPFGFVVCGLNLSDPNETRAMQGASKSLAADQVHVRKIADLLWFKYKHTGVYALADWDESNKELGPLNKGGTRLTKRKIMSELKRELVHGMYLSFSSWCSTKSRWRTMNAQTAAILDAENKLPGEKTKEIFDLRRELLEKFLKDERFGEATFNGAHGGRKLAKVMLEKDYKLDKSSIREFQKALVEAKNADEKLGAAKPSVFLRVVNSVCNIVGATIAGVAVPVAKYYLAGVVADKVNSRQWSSDAPLTPLQNAPFYQCAMAEQIRVEQDATFTTCTAGEEGAFAGSGVLARRDFRSPQAQRGLVNASELEEMISGVVGYAKSVLMYATKKGTPFEDSKRQLIEEFVNEGRTEAMKRHNQGALETEDLAEHRCSLGSKYLTREYNAIKAAFHEIAVDRGDAGSGAVADFYQEWKMGNGFGDLAKISPFVEERLPTSGSAGVLYSPNGAYFKNYKTGAEFRLSKAGSARFPKMGGLAELGGSAKVGVKIRAHSWSALLVGLGCDAVCSQKLSVGYCKAVIDECLLGPLAKGFLYPLITAGTREIKGEKTLADVAEETNEAHQLALEQVEKRGDELVSKVLDLGTATWRTMVLQQTALLYAMHYEAGSYFSGAIPTAAFFGCSALLLQENYHRIDQAKYNWKICNLASRMYSIGAQSSPVSKFSEKGWELKKSFGSALRFNSRTWMSVAMGGAQFIQAVHTGNYARGFAALFVATTTSLLSGYATYLKETMELAGELSKSMTEGILGDKPWNDAKMREVRERLIEQMHSSWRADFIWGLENDITGFLNNLEDVRKSYKGLTKPSPKQTAALLNEHQESLRNILATRLGVVNGVLMVLATGSLALSATTFGEAASDAFVKDKGFISKDEALFLRDQSRLARQMAGAVGKNSWHDLLATADLGGLLEGAWVPEWLADTVYGPMSRLSGTLGSFGEWLGAPFRQIVSSISSSDVTTITPSFRFAMAGSSLIGLLDVSYTVMGLAMPLVEFLKTYKKAATF